MMRNERNSRRNSLISLAVPVAVAVIVLVVIVRVLFSIGGDKAETARSGAESVNVVPKTENSEIYIYMSGDSKKKLEGEEKMFATDARLEIKSGDAELVMENSASKVFADKNTDVSYRGKTSDNQQLFELSNSYLWIEAGADDVQVKLRNMVVKPKSGSVVAVSQNAVGSNAYVLKGTADVATEASAAEVGVSQMVTVLSNEAKTVKLPDAIKPIDSFFRSETVYVKHDGDKYLLMGATGTEGSGSELTGTGLSIASPASSKGVVVTSPEDEASLETDTVDVEGKITNPNVVKVTVNEKDAKVDVEAKTFTFKDFPLPENANNLVYKAFDKDGNMLAKGVITVYSSAKKANVLETNKPTVTTYPISDKDFRIVAPSENPYKTTENLVRMEGVVPKGSVKYITINGFKLSKFVQFSSRWYYFANKDYGTMNDGINKYEIKYYGENGNLLKTFDFIIVKESAKAPEAAPETAGASTGASDAASSEKTPL